MTIVKIINFASYQMDSEQKNKYHDGVQKHSQKVEECLWKVWSGWKVILFTLSQWLRDHKKEKNSGISATRKKTVKDEIGAGN